MRRHEIVGGCTTFLSLVYILVVNPSILAAPGTGLSYSGVFTGTILITIGLTLLIGFLVRLPVAAAPGMGLNSYLAYTVIIGQQIPWQTAFGICAWAGAIGALLSISKFRGHLLDALPECILKATTSGIGLFLILLGFINCGLLKPDLSIAAGSESFKQVMIAFLGITLTGVLDRRGKSYAILLGILFTFSLAAISGLANLPAAIFAAPDFMSATFQVDLLGALKLSHLPVLIAVLVVILFDTVATLQVLAEDSFFTDRRARAKALHNGLSLFSVGTICSVTLGTSPPIPALESAAGMRSGGRTGSAAIVTALCFLPFLFLSPLLSAFPLFVTTPALVITGWHMFLRGRTIELTAPENLVSALLVLIGIPLSMSIAHGLMLGILGFVVTSTIAGRASSVSKSMWTVAVLTLAALLI